ncbi:GspH/FimT family protein, partial [Pseudomonas aeruginosa]
LCPSTDGRHCGSDWGEGWLLAEDGGERLLVGRALAKKERLRWNRSNRLRFLPSGQLNIHNGRFLLCGRHTVAWQLILNRQGRLRTASARENREKRELCSTSG